MRTIVPTISNKPIFSTKLVNLLLIIIFIISPLFFQGTTQVQAADLLVANFDNSTDGFSYLDDVFGTSKSAYASGTRVSTNCSLYVYTNPRFLWIR